MLERIEDGEAAEDLKMDVLQAIRFITSAWDEITKDTICNCWRHTGILADSSANQTNLVDNRPTSDPVWVELTNTLMALQFVDPMPLEEFLSNPEESIVSEELSDNEIVQIVVDMYKAHDIQNATGIGEDGE